MQKIIKTGKNIGVAAPIQGQTVDVIPHPRFKGLWQFECGGDTWMASNYSFEDE